MNNLMDKKIESDVESDDSEDDEEEAKETVLGALASIACYNCKKPGHKANNWPFKKKGKFGNSKWQNNKKKKRFSGSYNNCGKQGHKKADCWLLEHNKG